MTRRSLVIDSKDQGQFFLLVEGGTVTIGGSRKHADTVLQQLQVRRIRCELEVEGDHVTLRGDGANPPAVPRELKPGEVLDAGGSHFHLEVVHAVPTEPAGGTLDEDDVPGLMEDAAPQEEPAPAAAERSADEPSLRKRLFVIDGADMGQSFLLPESGSVTLGKDRKHADILLHDLYVSRVNCEVKIDGDKVTVVHAAGVSGTMINGKKITEEVLVPGDVLRIGNTHLRLECVVAGEEFAKVAGPGEEEDDRPIGVAEEGAGGDETVEEVEIVEDDDVAEEVEIVEDEETGGTEAADDTPESVRVLRVLRDKLMQLSGHTFGHYRLGSVLGRGCTGVVFRADHLETGQVVALKVFLPLFPHGDQELTRFARVMKGLLPLRHAHLVSLYSAGKTGTYTWIAREYIEGESLTELLRRLGKSKRLDWQLGLRVGIQLGRALDFARKHHLRHGKITPANIFLQRGDKVAKLADLMLGSALEGSRLWLAGQEHWPMRELEYLSPEQTAAGAFVDELSDMYSLGAVVYALLTGRPPFVSDTREGLIEEIQGPAKPAKPSKFNDDVPVSLEKVVLKMLTKRQEDRYQTPAELLEDLEPIEEEIES
jgi:hypothetical protein